LDAAIKIDIAKEVAQIASTQREMCVCATQSDYNNRFSDSTLLEIDSMCALPQAEDNFIQ
jgi:hypothetical protein